MIRRSIVALPLSAYLPAHSLENAYTRMSTEEAIKWLALIDT